MHPKAPNRQKGEKRLEAVKSEADLTVQDVYELGLEHDQENLEPRGVNRQSPGGGEGRSRGSKN